MTIQHAIHIGPGVSLAPRYLTRHIGIFGATGTGKTTTAASIVNQMSCPVIVLDAKGDLGGLGRTVAPWQGAQMSVAGIGADLLSRALELSEAQSGVLSIALAWAEDHWDAVDTLDDLASVLWLIARGDADVSQYGLASKLSIAAVQRAILRLRRAAPWAFGPKQFNPMTSTGVTVIHAPDLVEQPGLYAAFAAQMLDSIYTSLGEIGDAGAPGLAIVVDEAHLLFSDAPRAVVQRLEQIVRLIRSKGVSLIFVTQSPADLPPAIMGQLATRIQHGLRAATVGQQAAVRAAAETMPGEVKAADILILGMGEALVSTPDARGTPAAAQRVTVQPVAWQPVIFSDAPPRVSFSLTPGRLSSHEGNLQHIMVRSQDYTGRVEAVEVKRKPWWFWPAVVAAVVYLPMILL